MGTQGSSSVEIGRYDVASYALTHHAGIRVQQRGVNRDTLDCLLAYGHHESDHKGCSVVMSMMMLREAPSQSAILSW